MDNSRSFSTTVQLVDDATPAIEKLHELARPRQRPPMVLTLDSGMKLHYLPHPEWTTEKPVKPGAYWARCGDRVGQAAIAPTVFQVEYVGNFQLVAYRPGYAVRYELDQLDEFAGPWEPPL